MPDYGPDGSYLSYPSYLSYLSFCSGTGVKFAPVRYPRGYSATSAGGNGRN